MSRRLHLPLVALLACTVVAPASATCMMHKAPMAKASIVLKPQNGKSSLIRQTGADGKAHLARLRPGIWTAKLGQAGKPVTVTVGKNGKLSLFAESHTTQCHAPPHPNAPPPAPPSVVQVLKQI